MSVSQTTTIATLAKALTKAQAALQPALKEATNPYFKSSYADLASVWDACREALKANGLSVVQFPGYELGPPPFATLTTVLLHESGEWMAATAGAPLKQVDAQGVGSVITYLRRYALAAVVGVVQADDDGEKGVRTPKAAGGQKSTGVGAKGPTSAPPAVQPLTEKPKALTDEPDPWAPGEKLWPHGPHKGTPLKMLTSEQLIAGLAWIKKTGRYAELETPIGEVLEGRAGE